jgi:Protein of unknown function (DUF642)/PEP-CTERM motif
MRHALLVAGFLLAGLGSAGATQLITNGDFAAPSVGGGWRIYSNGGVPGWTSNHNEIEIDYYTAVGMNSCVSAPACQSMETNGTQPDAISQTVAGLAPGKSYTLSWEYGNRPGANGTESMNVLLNTAVVATNSDDGSGNWDANSYHFVATASSYVLTFAGQPGTGNPSYGNEVTDVSLIAAVPEPSSLIILAVAAAGLIGAMWRRGAAHSPTTLPRADLSRKAREIDPWGCVSGHREFSVAFSRPISRGSPDRGAA